MLRGHSHAIVKGCELVALCWVLLQVSVPVVNGADC